MSGFFIGLGTFVLMLTGIFLILIILMQRPSENAGLGSTLGGGLAESAFGGGASQVLTRWTIYGVITFFLLSFVLALSFIARTRAAAVGKGLPAIEVPVKGALTAIPVVENAKVPVVPAIPQKTLVVPVKAKPPVVPVPQKVVVPQTAPVKAVVAPVPQNAVVPQVAPAAAPQAKLPVVVPPPAPTPTPTPKLVSTESKVVPVQQFKPAPQSPPPAVQPKP